jgi:type II secretory pathway pseudopilin PulG
MPAAYRRRCAFSLMELLVVIAMVILLIALLTPVLRQARVAARSAQCKSNQRQIGWALLSYRTDQKQYWPIAGQQMTAGNKPISNSRHRGSNWFLAIDPYLHVFRTIPEGQNVLAWSAPLGVLQCPEWMPGQTAIANHVRWATPSGRWYFGHPGSPQYAMNQGLGYYPSGAMESDLTPLWNFAGQSRYFGNQAPEQVILLIDAWVPAPPVMHQPATWHQDKVEIYQSARWTFKPRWVGLGYGLNPDVYDIEGAFGGFRHNKHSLNELASDGHVQTNGQVSATPEQNAQRYQVRQHVYPRTLATGALAANGYP